MVEHNVGARPASASSEELRRQVELGWEDFDAGRVSDFDPEDIKKRGRDRRALIGAARPPTTRCQRPKRF